MHNDMDRGSFLRKFGGIYEHSAWVAEIVFDQKAHLDAIKHTDLAGAMAQAVETASPEFQMALLRAHPDLAGKLAVTGELTSDSTSEQASAGLNHCTPAEMESFTTLNTTYRKKFGFPYILAVRGRNRHEILENFQARVSNDVGQEFREALNQVHQIAKLRLVALDDAA